ncbi:caspase family protein [Actinosynnema sp. NPDC050436]|uniref:caspase, EACC1-associated type n=1 Tax=Actinosynnema sp. NPDC050436 TaxID=3155659 RepID=UPI0034006E34
MAILPDAARSRAVLIGTSDFRRADQFPALPAVRNNLLDLVSALSAADTGILGWQQCVVIDSPDSVSSFMERLRQSVNQAEDLLIVYYAGHGVRHDTRDELYLTVRHTDRDGLAGSAVPFDFVREVLADSPARVKLLILDCCYSGTALGAMSGNGIGTRDIKIAGTSVITSSPMNAVSHAPPGARNTAFTSELITLLHRGTSLPGSPLTVSALYRSLRAVAAVRGLPEPKFKCTDTSADILLRKEMPTAPAPTAPTSPTAPAVPPAELRPDPGPPVVPGSSSVLLGPPAASAVAPRRGELSGFTRKASRVVSGVLLIPLWLGVVCGVSAVVGGVLGFLFGDPPAGKAASYDLGMGFAVLLLGLFCAVVLRWPIAHLRAGRWPLTHEQALDVVLFRPLVRIPVFLSVIALLILLGTATAMVAGSSSAPAATSGSAVATTVSSTGILFGLAALFVLSIRNRRRAMGESSPA